MNALNTYFFGVIKNQYVDFAGRATRTQFWMYQLFMFLFALLISIVCSFLGDAGQVIYYVISIAVFLPSLAIAARRLHDIGRSAWWLLLYLLPLLGPLVLFIFFVLPSKN